MRVAVWRAPLLLLQVKTLLRDNAVAQAEAAGVSLEPPTHTLQQLPGPTGTKMTADELEKVGLCSLVHVRYA